MIKKQGCKKAWNPAKTGILQFLIKKNCKSLNLPKFRIIPYKSLKKVEKYVKIHINPNKLRFLLGGLNLKAKTGHVVKNSKKKLIINF